MGICWERTCVGGGGELLWVVESAMCPCGGDNDEVGVGDDSVILEAGREAFMGSVSTNGREFARARRGVEVGTPPADKNAEGLETLPEAGVHPIGVLGVLGGSGGWRRWMVPVGIALGVGWDAWVDDIEVPVPSAPRGRAKRTRCVLDTWERLDGASDALGRR